MRLPVESTAYPRLLSILQVIFAYARYGIVSMKDIYGDTEPVIDLRNSQDHPLQNSSGDINRLQFDFRMQVRLNQGPRINFSAIAFSVRHRPRAPIRRPVSESCPEFVKRCTDGMLPFYFPDQVPLELAEVTLMLLILSTSGRQSRAIIPARSRAKCCRFIPARRSDIGPGHSLK
jgi:hypothetical protein